MSFFLIDCEFVDQLLRAASSVGASEPPSPDWQRLAMRKLPSSDRFGREHPV
jgi:hypothetical protein